MKTAFFVNIFLSYARACKYVLMDSYYRESFKAPRIFWSFYCFIIAYITKSCFVGNKSIAFCAQVKCWIMKHIIYNICALVSFCWWKLWKFHLKNIGKVVKRIIDLLKTFRTARSFWKISINYNFLVRNKTNMCYEKINMRCPNFNRIANVY